MFLMTLLQELKHLLKTTAKQLTYSSKPTKAIHFTNNFQEKAKQWGLTEKDALDVYQHGQEVKDNMLIRRYSGYELGIWCFRDKNTGQTVITAIWKRERR